MSYKEDQRESEEVGRGSDRALGCNICKASTDKFRLTMHKTKYGYVCDICKRKGYD